MTSNLNLDLTAKDWLCRMHFRDGKQDYDYEYSVFFILEKKSLVWKIKHLIQGTKKSQRTRIKTQ